MTDKLEEARKAAANVFHGVLLAEGVIIQTNAFNAAIDAYEAKLAELGMVRVPREPTIGMFRALVASWPEEARAGLWTLGSFREDYQAMIAAAQGDGT